MVGGEPVFLFEIDAAWFTCLLVFAPIRRASFSMQMFSAAEHRATSLLHRIMLKLKQQCSHRYLLLGSCLYNCEIYRCASIWRHGRS
jgi:hypothetical protein